MEQSIYELYMEQVNPQDTREIMQAEDTLTALLKLVENLILWKSADGVTGTYTDDTGSSPYIETDVTIERLAEIVR